MNFVTLFLILPVLLTGCSVAFEIGESLNKATTNIASDPARYLWSKEKNATNHVPASAPVAASSALSSESNEKESIETVNPSDVKQITVPDAQLP